MKKNVIKIISVLLLAIMIIGISNTAFALVDKVTPRTEGKTAERAGSIGGIITGILQVIGVAAAIVMLVFLGIKYVSAAPAEKAEIKKSAAIYVVGAVMLLGASMILGWIGDFVSDDLETATTKTTEQYIHLA